VRDGDVSRKLPFFIGLMFKFRDILYRAPFLFNMKTKFKDYADFSHSALQIISMLGGKVQIKKT
jgi:hypothetical protein